MSYGGVMGVGEGKSFGEEDKSIEMKKFCTDCKTTKTPLWRGGPAGPKSLCNACGIRYKKKRRIMLGLPMESKKKKRKAHFSKSSRSSSATSASSGNELRESLKMRLIVVGEKLMFQRSTIVKKQRCQRKRKLMIREEEQAAFSLMALSCGSMLA